MKKIECNLDSYPNILPCEGGEAYRYYTLLPMQSEADFLSKCRIDNDLEKFSLNTLIISVFKDADGNLYFAFGCTFFDKISENERLFAKDESFLDLVKKIAMKQYNDKGLEFKRNYYLFNALYLIERLKNGTR